MKLAVIFDDLIQFGGAEKLLLTVHEMWPDAPVYTSYASDKWLKIVEKEKILLKTSFMQKLPFKTSLNKVYAAFLLYPLAFESFDLSCYDTVFSISARFAHGVITKPGTKHICYMNSPGRMFWEPALYFRSKSKLITGIQLGLLSLPLNLLKLWDYTAAQRVDTFISNSKTSCARIKKYYSRDSHIIYPFVDYKFYAGAELQEGSYYLIISRLVSWKRIDIAIKACNKLNTPLKIVGVGKDFNRLKRISGASVEFLGYVSDVEKRKYISNCTAIINTQFEDFGIVPLEAMACGKPVIAYKKGGVLETVIPGKTGEFFLEQTIESLIEVLQKFDAKNYLISDCKEQALKFTKEKFVNRLKLVLRNSI